MSVLRFNTSVDDLEFRLRKAQIILTLRKVGAPECAIKPPVSLLDIYRDQDCEGKLTTWTLAAFALEREGKIETWSRNGHLYLKFTEAYLRECGMTELGAALGCEYSCGTVEGHGDDAQAGLSRKGHRTDSRGSNADIDRTGKGVTLAAGPDSSDRNAISAMPVFLEEGKTRQVGTQAPPAGMKCDRDQGDEDDAEAAMWRGLWKEGRV